MYSDGQDVTKDMQIAYSNKATKMTNFVTVPSTENTFLVPLGENVSLKL